MPICSTCGAADHMRCNCVVEPYCDQCDENDACNSEMDTACVIYHPTYPGQTPLPSQLTTLALPNGSSAQTIFEAIDAYLAAHTETPITGIDTPSINLTTTLHTIQADAIISPDTNNQLSIHSNGLFAAPYNDLFQVKIDATSAAKYLVDSLIGGTDGCVNVDVVHGAGLLQIQPSIDVVCLVERICDADITIKEALVNCLPIPVTPTLGFNDTNSIDLDITANVLTANSKISATTGNSIVINADGLFVPASSAGLTINNNADNRILTANGTTTSIDAEADLTYDQVTGALVAPLFTPVLATTNAGFTRAAFSAGLNLTQANYGTKVGNMTGVFGAIQYQAQVNTTFGRGYFIGGSISEPAYNTINGSSSSGLLASSVAKMDMFGNGVYTDIANIRTVYPSTDNALGGLFSGSITNYYAVFIGQKNVDEGGISPVPTNTYGIFQEGTAFQNLFNGTIVVPNLTTAAGLTAIGVDPISGIIKKMSSSRRYKENIQPLNSSSIEKFYQLQGKNFQFKTDKIQTAGFIAEEVDALGLTDLVNYNIDKQPESLRYDAMTAYLLEMIKELNNRIEILEQK